jgi:hypothetical protein
MKKFFSKEYIWHWIAGLMAFHMFTFPFVYRDMLQDTGPTWFGLDISWKMTINYAIQHGWVWGKDIIYTYGPLGFLSVRFGLGISRWVYVAFDFFLVINYFFLFKDFIATARNKFIGVLIIFCITLILNTNPGADLSWVLTIFSFYWMYKTYKEPKIPYFIFISALTTFCFFLKLNTGLIGICFLVVHVLNLLIYKKIKLPLAIGVLLMQCLLISLFALILHVNLPGYIKGAFEIVKGYNDIMYLDDQQHTATEENVNILFWGILFLHIFYGVYLIVKRNFSKLFFIGIGLAYLFLIQKQALLRSDMQHLYEFFPYATFLVVYGGLLPEEEKPQKFFLNFILLIIILGLVYSAQFLGINDAFIARYTNQLEYRKEHKGYNMFPFIYQWDKRHIPDPILKKIGNSTIDIFPWDTEYLIENKLNYLPRPVFQSFSAYTEYLQKINYKHFLEAPPEYIIYDYDGIDSRYPFNDEPLTNFFIVKNYTIEDTFTSNERWRLLLHKKKTVTPLTIQKIKEQTISIKDEFTPDGANFLKIYIDYNKEGKMQAFRAQPPRVTISYMRPSGEWLVYKASKELLKAGISADKIITSNRDFADYFNKKDSLSQVSKLKVLVDSSYKFADPAAKIEYYKIN